MGKGSSVFALWTWILSHCDKTGHLEINPKLAALQIGMDEEEARKTIVFFMKPDPASRTPDLEGRKLEKVGVYLYRVVNYEKYLAVRNRDQRREQNRVAQERFREKQSGNGSDPVKRGRKPKTAELPAHSGLVDRLEQSHGTAAAEALMDHMADEHAANVAVLNGDQSEPPPEVEAPLRMTKPFPDVAP